MAADAGLQFRDAVSHLWQRAFVAFGQLANAAGQGLADAVHFAVNGGVEGGEPFFFDEQGLDLGLAQRRVVGAGFEVEFGLGFAEPLFQCRFFAGQGQPALEDGKFVGGFQVFGADLANFPDAVLDPGGVDLVEAGKHVILAAVFFFEFSALRGDAFEVGTQLLDGRLLGGEIAGNDQGFGQQVAGPTLVLFLALFVLLYDPIGRRLPAVGGHQVGIVLHGRRPVVEQVLVDVVGVDERALGVVDEQAFANVDDQLLGVEAGRQGLELLRPRLAPDGEVAVHAGDEGGEFGVAVDAGLDGGFGDGQIKVAGAPGLEQACPELRADGPVAGQGLDVGERDAALEMAFDILLVLALAGVDVARQVEVVVVLLDFVVTNQPCGRSSARWRQGG